MFSSRRLSTSLNFSFLPGSSSRSAAASPTTPADMTTPHRSRHSVQIIPAHPLASPTRPSDPTPSASISVSAAVTNTNSPTTSTATPANTPAVPHASSSATTDLDSDLTISFVPQPSLNSNHPPLTFTRVTRTLSSPNAILRIGRYSDPLRAPREDQLDVADNIYPSDNAAPLSGPDDTSNNHNSMTMNLPAHDSPVGFKSKVVSRRHCEIWVQDSEWYIKDVKSSSGTFVNHFRLSGPKSESTPHKIRNGDLIQLGIDYRGGQEELYRCVKMTVVIGKNAHPRATKFNRSTLKNLTNGANGSTDICSICLCKIAPCQALFMAPCSHVWHYKCILRLLNGPSNPSFLCPNCRCLSSLDADIEDVPEEEDEADDIKEVGINALSGDLPPDPFSHLHEPTLPHSPPSQNISDGNVDTPTIATGDDGAGIQTPDDNLASGIGSISLAEPVIAGPSTSRPHLRTGLYSQSLSSIPSRLLFNHSPPSPFQSEFQQTAVNPSPLTPKSESDPATPPRLSYIDTHNAVNGTTAEASTDYSSFSTPLAVTAAFDDAQSVMTPPNTVGPYVQGPSVLADADLNSRMMLGDRLGSPSPMPKQ